VSSFQLKNGSLYAEQVSLTTIGEQYQTPCYVYSKTALTEAFKQFQITDCP